MNDNDWFFETFQQGPRRDQESRAKVTMLVLWLFIIAGVVCSLSMVSSL